MKKINFNRKTKGFTLAETLITLTILGVVAVITVPMLINKQMESANRTKLKKAMAAYEKALNQIIVDNDIKGSITAVEGFRLTDNCSGSRPYFKAIKEIAGNNCRFQTADKVWWDITNIEHPVISLKDQITTQAESDAIKAKANNLEKDKTSFVMVGEIKDGIVRINDMGALEGNDQNEDYLNKLYAFIEKKTMEDAAGSESGVSDPPSESSESSPIIDLNKEYPKFYNGEYNNVCTTQKQGCYEVIWGTVGEDFGYKMYDSNGNFFAYGSGCIDIATCDSRFAFSKITDSDKIIYCHGSVNRCDYENPIDKSIVCTDMGLSTEECANL